MDEFDLTGLYEDPVEAGRLASGRRDEILGRQVVVSPAPAVQAPQVAAIVRGPSVLTLDHWPHEGCEPGDLLLVQVDATAEARTRYAAWLHEVSERLPAGCRVAPFSREAAALHRLWCIAAARLALPATIHVEVRHDLLGIRLAQIALGFGSDRLSGPVDPDRVLPLAGVTRPSEATRTGLATLVAQAGLDPVLTGDESRSDSASLRVPAPQEKRP